MLLLFDNTRARIASTPSAMPPISCRPFPPSCVIHNTSGQSLDREYRTKTEKSRKDLHHQHRQKASCMFFCALPAALMFYSICARVFFKITEPEILSPTCRGGPTRSSHAFLLCELFPLFVLCTCCPRMFSIQRMYGIHAYGQSCLSQSSLGSMMFGQGAFEALDRKCVRNMQLHCSFRLLFPLHATPLQPSFARSASSIPLPLRS